MRLFSSFASPPRLILLAFLCLISAGGFFSFAGAQTAEIVTGVQAPAQPSPAGATAEVSLPAATAEVKVAVPDAATPAAATAEVKASVPGTQETAVGAVQKPAEPKAPAAPEKKDEKAGQKPSFTVKAVPDEVFTTPGSTFDLSGVSLVVKYKDGTTKKVDPAAWKADQGEVSGKSFKAPGKKAEALLTAEYSEDGQAHKAELTVNVRPIYRDDRLIVFYLAIILAGIVLYSINHAVGGKQFFIRKIGGLNAIDEAVGRATEMGKPVLYLTGLSDMSAISTIASVSILSYVAKKAAEYETPLHVPCCRSLVMNTAREVVKESYLEAGKPDSFNPENIKYITDDQFGFVSGVDGIMLREKPAANFYLGHFMAESLIYAETGNSIGAIQIAGTSEFSQIPFFVAACDYCLIGEELFAASAYLSRKPKDVGTLRGQDLCKLAIMIVIIIGVILETTAVLKPDIAATLTKFKAIFFTN